MSGLDNGFEAFCEETGFENVLLKYKIREVVQQVRGPRVLDVGCGVGFLCRSLSEHVAAVVGVDGSPAKIGRARERNAAANITYYASRFEDWMIPGRFDTIVTTNVLEHVDNPQEFLGRCSGGLNDAGRIIITVPNAVGLHKRIGKHMGLIQDYFALTKADQEKGHQRIYDRAGLEAEVVRAGFRVLISGGILLKPLSHLQMESWEPRVVDALYEIGKELPDYCSSLMVVGEKQG